MDTLNVSQIFPNPDQPRQTFDPDSLRELAEDIAAHGLIEPLVVVNRKLDSAYYIRRLPAEVRELVDEQHATHMIVAGERRWRACHIAGLTEVPVRELNLHDSEVFEIALAENITRADMKPTEEGRALNRLRDKYGLTIAEIARRYGKSEGWVRDRIKLLSLDPEIAILVDSGQVPISVGVAISKLTPDRQHRVIKLMNEEGLNAMEACFLADQLFNEQEQGTLFDLSAYMAERAAEAAAKWLEKGKQTTEKIRDALVTAVQQLPLEELEAHIETCRELLEARTLVLAGADEPGPGQFEVCPRCRHYADGVCLLLLEQDNDPVGLDGEECFEEQLPTLEELEQEIANDAKLILAHPAPVHEITPRVSIKVCRFDTDHKALAAGGITGEADHHLVVAVLIDGQVAFTLTGVENVDAGRVDFGLDFDYLDNATANFGFDIKMAGTVFSGADWPQVLAQSGKGERLYRED